MLPRQITFRSSDNRKRRIDILYHDERYLIVDKPAGLAVIPDRWQKAPVNLRDLLQREVSRIGNATVHVVHRIDQDTSGLVMFALDPDIHRQLNSLFEENRIDKTYLAFCQGQALQSSGIVNLSLQPSSGRTYKTVVSKKGKEAQTAYQILEQYRDFCLVEIKPTSGRTHQIRVHMQQIGLPLAVDPLYTSISSLKIFDIKRRRGRNSDVKDTSSLIDRLTLHASALSFTDPVDGILRSWETPFPADMTAVHKALQKYGQKQEDNKSTLLF